MTQFDSNGLLNESFFTDLPKESAFGRNYDLSLPDFLLLTGWKGYINIFLYLLLSIFVIKINNFN